MCILLKPHSGLCRALPALPLALVKQHCPTSQCPCFACTLSRSVLVLCLLCLHPADKQFVMERNPTMLALSILGGLLHH